MRKHAMRVGKMQCPDCVSVVSSIAVACRHCGHKFSETQITEQKAFEDRIKKISPYIGGMLALAGLLGIGTCSYRQATHVPSAAEIYQAQTAAFVISKFKAEGTAAAAVKERLSNPSSFELVGANATPGKTDSGEPGWIVGVTYRGTNGFGKIVPGNAIVSISQSGEVPLKVIDLRGRR